LHDSTRDDTSTEILEDEVRISEDNDVSLKQERFSVFVNFIFEKEHSNTWTQT